jgi:3-deoxy-7-phosphoheptulonate synthase
VLLKRGLSSTLDELLQAADYILKEGNERVILCERGIRTFDNAMRFTLDLGAVPWLKLPHAPAGDRRPVARLGDRRLVGPLSRAAAAVGRGRDHRRRWPRTPSWRSATDPAAVCGGLRAVR